MTRNDTSIVGIALGDDWHPGRSFSMIGAHTDSPCLRVKPISKKQCEGFLQVGVETYGGGLWHTWFDRDLSLAGRVMVKSQNSVGADTTFVHIKKPILRIPTLAIHLDRQEKFEFNKETQLLPIAGLISAELNKKASQGNTSSTDNDNGQNASFSPLKSIKDRHHPYIVELIAKHISKDPDLILDFELVLYDTQKSCLGGLNDEFIFSARLDNLTMSYCSIMGLINSLSEGSTQTKSTARIAALFDHEEIGSRTTQGADSNFLPSVLHRLSCLESRQWGKYNPTAYDQALASSFLISADMAHSIHPNYASKYEADHHPEMNKGTVIKVNANARYATNSVGIVCLQDAARRAKKTSFNSSNAESGVPLQLFVVRNDSSCGSTIGPMLSAALGMRTIDVGNAQLSMHSIRETAGALDLENSVNLFDSFYRNFSDDLLFSSESTP